MDFLAIFELSSDGSYNAYVPDLPGCISVGDSLDDVKKNINEAISLHIECMKDDGDDIPEPTTRAELISV